MIFAAGLGTRLQGITKNTPKALVKVLGKPMLEHVINKLKCEGINEFVINVHHYADQINKFLDKNNNFDSKIYISDETNLLLETGGGLKKAEKYLSGNGNFLVYNVDIFSDVDIKKLILAHKQNNSLATLAVNKRESSRRLLFDEENYLCEWENITTGERKPARKPKGKLNALAFSGIHIINPRIFNLITETGKFSIIDVYLRLAKNYKISSFSFESEYWFDLGKPENIKQVELYLSNN